MNNYGYLEYSQDILQKMEHIPALKPFEGEELQELLRLSEIRKYKPGELILEEGRYEGWMYYLVSGRARITKKGKELLVLKRTGDIFGEMGAIDDSARSASVYAMDATVCLAIDISDIDKLSFNNKFALRYIIYREFSEILAKRLRSTTEELIKAKEQLEKFNLAAA